MFWLACSIAVSSLLFIVFKLFHRYRVDNFQAIVVNYFVASGLGFAYLGKVDFGHILSAPWLWVAMAIGVLFITLFFVMAKVTQENGISVASVSNKMSVIIPVIVAFSLYNETVGFLKVSGIALALTGIYLVTVKNGSGFKQAELFKWPVVLFVGSGILDSLLKYAQHNLMREDEFSLFTPTAFGFAGILGFVALLLRRKNVTVKSALWGVVLGVPNYFSILLILLALNVKNLESSVVFPMNNIGVVMLSTITSVIFFKEKLISKNWIGIACSIVAIVLIALSR